MFLFVQNVSSGAAAAAAAAEGREHARYINTTGDGRECLLRRRGAEVAKGR